MGGLDRTPQTLSFPTPLRSQDRPSERVDPSIYPSIHLSILDEALTQLEERVRPPFPFFLSFPRGGLCLRLSLREYTSTI